MEDVPIPDGMVLQRIARGLRRGAVARIWFAYCLTIIGGGICGTVLIHAPWKPYTWDFLHTAGLSLGFAVGGAAGWALCRWVAFSDFTDTTSHIYQALTHSGLLSQVLQANAYKTLPGLGLPIVTDGCSAVCLWLIHIIGTRWRNPTFTQRCRDLRRSYIYCVSRTGINGIPATWIRLPISYWLLGSAILFLALIAVLAMSDRPHHHIVDMAKAALLNPLIGPVWIALAGMPLLIAAARLQSLSAALNLALAEAICSLEPAARQL